MGQVQDTPTDFNVHPNLRSFKLSDYQTFTYENRLYTTALCMFIHKHNFFNTRGCSWLRCTWKNYITLTLPLFTVFTVEVWIHLVRGHYPKVNFLKTYWHSSMKISMQMIWSWYESYENVERICLWNELQFIKTYSKLHVQPCFMY